MHANTAAAAAASASRLYTAAAAAAQKEVAADAVVADVRRQNSERLERRHGKCPLAEVRSPLPFAIVWLFVRKRLEN